MPGINRLRIEQGKHKMVPESQPITFDTFVKNAQTIFDSFPNEAVFTQGGLKPNRQLQYPEAGYCIMLRYAETVTRTISHFMAGVHSIMPSILNYRECELHTTIGTYGKREMGGFSPESIILHRLMQSIEKGLNDYSKGLSVRFGKWLYNDEAILVSGYPNQELWTLFQAVGNACQENRYPLQMGQITHITTARFTMSVSPQTFVQFKDLMQTAPVMEPAKPIAIDLATWHCDGHSFELATHKRYCL